MPCEPRSCRPQQDRSGAHRPTAGCVPFEALTKVDEGHVLAFTAKLEFEDSFVERQSFLNVAHFKGNVVETHSARSSGFGHEILMGRAVRGLDRNLGAQLPAASGFRLELLSGIPDVNARQEKELELQITLGHSLMAAKGLAAPEPGEAFARARQLCENLARPQQLGMVLSGQWIFTTVRGELDQAEHYSEELRRLGEARNDAIWACFGSTIQRDY